MQKAESAAGAAITCPAMGGISGGANEEQPLDNSGTQGGGLGAVPALLIATKCLFSDLKCTSKGLSSLDANRGNVRLPTRVDIGAENVANPMVKRANFEKVSRFLCLNWSFVHNYADMDNDTIWIGWDDEVLRITLLHSMEKAIHCLAQIRGKGIWFYLSVIHGHNSVMDHIRVWSNLRQQASLNNDLPWIVMGDFNVVQFSNERIGGSTDWPPCMEECNNCLINAELEDLKYTSFHLTWTNCQYDNDTILRKLDRVLANDRWMVDFSNSEVKFLPSSVSDHSPMIVRTRVDVKCKGRSFKFFNFWLECEAFEPAVRKAWNQDVEGYAMFILSRKLKVMKKELKLLNQVRGRISYQLY
ncbi:hypothetical protein F0562_012015 [Nyssa sinensis]|uniref:Endonuclease/exonuclease/phosphatase domain-containing protein n=1 Tax=Nyssa sinensis TaxID=561372 RepID=A0A5J4ZW98_9ASTE|nr:hypothetical protein F0562_012015 [Nyssa sinensis]